MIVIGVVAWIGTEYLNRCLDMELSEIRTLKEMAEKQILAIIREYMENTDTTVTNINIGPVEFTLLTEGKKEVHVTGVEMEVFI